jgi:tetratricopeptide (TPR) repeat protein
MNRCAKLLLPLACLALAACASRVQKQPAPAAAAPPPPPAGTVVGTAPAAPDKGDPEQRFQEALGLMKSKKPQEAKDAFAKLAQDFPGYAGPLNNLGVLQAQGKQRDQAIASFAKAVAADGKDDFAYGWLGVLYRESGNYRGAEQAYLKAIAIKPDNPVTRLNLGILYDAYMRRPQDALAQYREYQRIAGKDSKPIVTAWINELQDNQAQAAAVATPAGTAPVERMP